MTNESETATWQVRWDGFTRWQIIEPLGKPSEEGTQAIRLIAECRERTVADAIIEANNQARRVPGLEAACEATLKWLEFCDLPGANMLFAQVGKALNE